METRKEKSVEELWEELGRFCEKLAEKADSPLAKQDLLAGAEACFGIAEILRRRVK